MPRTTTTPHRSDPEIFADARKALDQSIVPRGVHVHVDGGTLTLTGTVRLPAERAAAEEAVRTVEGLRGIRNDVAVTQIVDPSGFEPPE